MNYWIVEGRFDEHTGRQILTSHPQSKEEAIAIDDHLYSDLEDCPVCKTAVPNRYVKNDQCLMCLMGTYNDYAASLQDTEFTTVPKPCKGGPHFPKFLRGSTNRKCLTCQETKRKGLSPRQRALAAGETWYMPETVCPHCHTVSLKRVDNGACRGCKPAPGPRSQPNPLPSDTIIDRKTARVLGFKLYRTGDYCRKGHAGFRYVSTGQCQECHRLRSQR